MWVLKVDLVGLQPADCLEKLGMQTSLVFELKSVTFWIYVTLLCTLFALNVWVFFSLSINFACFLAFVELIMPVDFCRRIINNPNREPIGGPLGMDRGRGPNRRVSLGDGPR